MEPITDRRHLFGAMAGAAFETRLSVDASRAGILEGILPTPIGPISAREIACFKSRHANLLIKFRDHVERSVTACARAHDPILRKRLVDEARAELSDASEEVGRRMSERKWPTGDGTVCALVSAAGGVVGGFAADKPELAATGGAVPVLVDYVHSRFAGRLGDPPAATYAVLAQKRFGERGAATQA
jgi:hypothetical protein